VTISLPTKTQLTTEVARAVADAAVAEATKQNLRMSIAVVDDGGHLLYFIRMSEQIAAGSVEAAMSKAQSAAMFKRATLSWEEAAKDRAVVMKIPNVMPLGGGVPLIVNNVGIGAIGVSGASSVKDDEVARAGAQILA
jgi:glc operon protein GlcG